MKAMREILNCRRREGEKTKRGFLFAPRHYVVILSRGSPGPCWKASYHALPLIPAMDLKLLELIDNPDFH
jgi:hypothetical protein